MFSSNQPVCWDTICQKLCLGLWFVHHFVSADLTQSQWEFLLTQTLGQSQCIHKKKWLYSLREEKLSNFLVKWDSSLDTDLDYWRRKKEQHGEFWQASWNREVQKTACPITRNVI